MSKHKHFHNIKTPMQMLQHSRRNGFGPLHHWEPKKKVPAPPAGCTAERGKEVKYYEDT